MTPHTLTLIERNKLTHDVWELVYESDKNLWDKPGQFLLCDCAPDDPRLKRSYSISWSQATRYEFIIKRLPQGTGGSIAICDQEIGHKMQVMGPLGEFTLRENDNPKVFIGTGTGFAPLYYMMRCQLERDPDSEIQFIFWVREKRDLFYLDVFNEWREKYSNFSYQLCVSREEVGQCHHGRVTDIVASSEQREARSEFYICGSPAMVTDTRQILRDTDISPEQIFFEQY